MPSKFLSTFVLMLPGYFALSGQVQLDIHQARPAAEIFHSPELRVDVNLVLLPVIVTTRAGVVVDGLTESSFTVTENKNPQPIVSFGQEDLPCSVGVVVDLSGSMQSKKEMAANALRAFFDTANPADEAFLMTVSTRPNTLAGFTEDFGKLDSQLRAAHAGGATALLDTVRLALDRLRGAHNSRRALLVISDGMDNHSRYSEPELLQIAEEADVQIHTIGTATAEVNKKAIELTEARNGLSFLQHLAECTGGLGFTLAGYENPVPAASKIGHAIRDQYLIGYRSPANDSGTWRAVQVRVDQPELRVSTRNGYYSR